MASDEATLSPGPTSDLQIPTEVVEHIIDCLQDSKADLATCKLVHRTWTPRARMHLHRALVFTLPQWRVAQIGTTAIPSELHRFPEVARQVRKLVVDFQVLEQIINHSSLFQMDLVESLRVKANVASIGDDTKLLSLSGFPQFPRLKHLHVEASCFSTQLEMVLAIAVKAHTIQSLTVDISSSRWARRSVLAREEIEAVFNGHNCSFPCLDTLNLRCHWHDLRRIGRLPQTVLDLAGRSLRHLTLTCSRYYHEPPEDFFGRVTDLGFLKNACLETITIQFCWRLATALDLGPGSQQQLRLYMDTLGITMFMASLCSTQVRAMTIRFYIDDYSDWFLERLRKFDIRWLNIFVAFEIMLGLMSEWTSKGGPSRDESMALFERLQTISVELIFSCEFTAAEAAQVYAHAHAQLTDLAAHGVLKLNLVHSKPKNQPNGFQAYCDVD